LNGFSLRRDELRIDPGWLPRFCSAIAWPLEGLSGVAGVLTLYHYDSDAFTRDHLRILLAIGSKAGLTFENALCDSGRCQTSATTDR